MLLLYLIIFLLTIVIVAIKGCFDLNIIDITNIISYNKTRWQRRRRLPFPPGPKRWPIVGNLLSFRNSPLASMMKWKKMYGDIVGLQLGEYKAVLLSDLHLIKEAMNNEAFNARPDFKPFILIEGGLSKGTLTSTGVPWDQLRKFTIKRLNELGFGKSRHEGFILDNIHEFVGKLQAETSSGQSSIIIEPHKQFRVPVSANLWYILTGQIMPKCHYAEFEEILINLRNALFQPIGSIIWFYPTLINWFPNNNWTGWKNMGLKIRPFKELIERQIQRHYSFAEQTNNQNNTDRDGGGCFIDAFFTRIKTTNDPTSPFYKETGADNMKSMLFNLVEAAADNLNNILSWSILYLSLYPDVQEKMYLEICSVIGTDHCPSLDDQAKLPYTKATLQELLRISSISPFSNFHSATTDVEFHGYFIPKGTVIIGNLYGLHHDEGIWGDPENFRPERFLNNTSGDVSPPTIPFSVGLRSCLGQTYAKTQMFLLLTYMVQKFKFSLDDEKQMSTSSELWINHESHVSWFRYCPSFKAKLFSRTTTTTTSAC